MANLIFIKLSALIQRKNFINLKIFHAELCLVLTYHELFSSVSWASPPMNI